MKLQLSRQSAHTRRAAAAMMVCPVLLLIFACSRTLTTRGQIYPEMASPDGGCTLILFMTENPEYYSLQSDEFVSVVNLEYLISRIKLDLNILLERYPDLNIEFLDVQCYPRMIRDYRLYEIPTVIMFDPQGQELKRWLPRDFQRGGNFQQEVEALLSQTVHPEPEY